MKRTETGVQLGTWLRDVRAQERDRGVDHYELACHASRLTPYIKDNMSQALRDLERLWMRLPTELMGEDEQRLFWEEYRAEYIRQVQGALVRFAASLTAVGCTEEELALAFDGASEKTEESDTGEGNPKEIEEGDSAEDETIRLEVKELREKAADPEVTKGETARALT